MFMEQHDQINEELATEALIARINTREESTLVISTVAASISLTILAIVFDKNPIPTWVIFIGTLFSLFGIFYREATVSFSDSIDYRELKERLGDRLPRHPAKAVIPRGVVFRVLL